jgi:MurNAc alpha-1-phosphate uridylyltransferase
MTEVNRAVLLAAGLGTRLKWLTAGKPKAMMLLGDEPAIVRAIRSMAGQGVHDIAINVHHHADKLIDYLGDGSRFGVRLYFSRERELLDSGGGVRKAMALLPGNGPVVVHNADVLADIDLHHLSSFAPAGGASLAMVANPYHHPAGDFALSRGLISDEEKARYTYAGVSVWDERCFAGFEIGSTFSLTVPMRQLMEKSMLGGVLHRGFWFDIGRPRDLIQAREFISRESMRG